AARPVLRLATGVGRTDIGAATSASAAPAAMARDELGRIDEVTRESGFAAAWDLGQPSALRLRRIRIAADPDCEVQMVGRTLRIAEIVRVRDDIAAPDLLALADVRIDVHVLRVDGGTVRQRVLDQDPVGPPDAARAAVIDERDGAVGDGLDR